VKKETFPYSETKRKERGTMKKMIVVLSLLLTVFIPKVSYSQDKGTRDLEDADKREVLDVRNKLGENIKRLSLLSEDMKQVYTSMGASQPENRFLIMHCRENVANTEGIYRYVVDGLDQLLLIKKNKISYYGQLEEYGLEQMRRLQDEYLNNIQRMYSQISSEPALYLIDEAVKTIHSSSGLLDKAIEIIEQHGKQGEAGIKRNKET
jgi:hypothetical protein